MRTDSTGTSWWTDFWKSTTGQVLGWIGTGVLLGGLTALSVLTFGASAPITGLAASVVIGTTIGAYIGAVASFIVQTHGFTQWNNIESSKLLSSGLMGGSIGAISGGMSFGFAQIGQSMGEVVGQMLGSALSRLPVLSTIMTKGLAGLFCATGYYSGYYVGGFIGGYIGGKIGNNFANQLFASKIDHQTGMQGGLDFPRWLISVLRWLGTHV